ncbi:hypothetical protein FHX49_001131 [Microbacterium endophyticum]|uniref:CBM6 domain-containing protein n=1 Tax=Microbacterium endophyticum TaxID=1526412 RepID=A0A7W4YLL5_9MICO|nr:hypothetical protein [Microbacterium endophyticum]MBB2975565.1 hypothetical protein [Microbacterium endophyticum]NIK35416.1 hypothetical protein [Microbacterium endophyticum]
MVKSQPITACGVVAALVLTPLAALPASAADTQTLSVDFSHTTGDFRGGASGALYGLGDEGAPTEALLNGAAITNVSQKAPYGTQHPSGDALKVEDGFFQKHGEDMYIYVQDYYPDWPYNGGARPGDDRTYNLSDGSYTNGGNGIWDFLEVTEFVADAVASDSSYPESYVFIPFNEPDGGNWYPNWGAQQDQFLADWQSIYDTIQRVWSDAGLGHARIGGGGDTRWQPERSADILSFAKANDSLPDVFIWHELGIDNLATYRQHFADYRALEVSLGIDPIPINITEYGMLRDMGVPGQLVQWFAMFEDTKVDAQVAYWNYAGNLSDNSARPNGANAGWWMFNWYGNLAGSQTVAVTPPQLNAADTLQGIGAIDADNRKATVLWGGTGDDVTLELSGLDPEVFGSRVDVEVRETTLAGAEGLANTPRVVEAFDGVSITDGATSLTVPTYDRYAGYQLVITPAQTRDVQAEAASQAWNASSEAEALQLTSAQAYTQNPTASGGWKFLASGGRDVGSFNRASSKADWSVDVPADGTYRLQVIGSTPGKPGQHAIFVDGESAGIIQYTADLALNDTSRWQYRGSAEKLVELTAGSHALSFRASENGSSVLPNADISLDKVSLTRVDEGEKITYPASTFRLVDGAALDWDTSLQRGWASISADQHADVYLTAMDTGYYDLGIDWASSDAGNVTVSVNGQVSTLVTSTEAGRWASTARVHLVEGINEVELHSDAASIGKVSTQRAREADDAQVSVEAEAATLGGTASVSSAAAGSNASGGKYVGYVGNGAANTIAINRTTGIDQPGDYDVTVHYSNAEVSGRHDYNPQVVDRRIDLAEAGSPVGQGYFRYTYAWESFWQRSVAVTLQTGDQPLVLGNASAYAPNIDRIVVSPRVLGAPTTDALATPSGVLTLSKNQTTAGEEVSVSGSEFSAGDVVTLTLYSDPIELGSVTAGADGTFALDAMLPVDVPAGNHTLRAVADPSGTQAEASLSVAAAAGGGGSGSGGGGSGGSSAGGSTDAGAAAVAGPNRASSQSPLAVTGAAIGPWAFLIGVGAIAIGGLIVSARRARRS